MDKMKYVGITLVVFVILIAMIIIIFDCQNFGLLILKRISMYCLPKCVWKAIWTYF